jgi:hypothetical protein
MRFDASATPLVIRPEPATLPTATDSILNMFTINNPALWLLGIIVLGAAIFGLRRYFSAEAREAWRCARSYGPVVTRKRGPAILLNVAVDGKIRNRDR